MFYATAGQQATQQPPSIRNAALGGGAGGGYARGGPPGFASRGAADPNDFPALGSHPQHSSTYAAQAQPSAGSGQQSSSQANPGQGNQQHLSQQQQQQLFLAAQQQQQQMGSVPPPPPGISGPNNASAGNGGQANGAIGGDDFPALGGSGELKDVRLANYLRSNAVNPSQQGGQPSSPTAGMGLSNGNISLPSASQSQSQSVSTNATPSTNPPHPHPQGGQGSSASGAPSVNADSTWHQRSNSPRSSDPVPVVRPVQQILSSPVDKWGLKALLYEIQVHMNKTDRGVLSFGEELEELGMDVNSEEPLYPSFVTPWTDVNSLSQPPQIEESYHIPQCYNVNAPPVASKLTNFNEDTLLLAFYMSPQDVLQLEVAEELYVRGWRYHTDLQLWLTSPTLANVDLQAIHADSSGQPSWIPGPFIYLDTRTWTRQRTLEDFTVDAQLLEATKPAHMRLGDDANPSGNVKGNGQSPPISSASASGPSASANGSQLSASVAGSFTR
ncbi:hypothetical protein IAU59_004549 [Kwoniella sp. CBS 9459]